MITPAEVIWPLIVLLFAAAGRIAIVLLKAEQDTGPAFAPACPARSDNGARQHDRTGRAGPADLRLAAQRTDTLLWYAAKILGGQYDL